MINIKSVIITESTYQQHNCRHNNRRVRQKVCHTICILHVHDFDNCNYRIYILYQ